MNKKYVISVGGGIASTLLLVLKVIALYGRENVDLIWCRLPNEHPDLFRLVKAVENLVGIVIKDIGLGLEPFDIFDRDNFLGNSLHDPCSKNLKRDVILAYMQKNYDKENTVICVGITAHETARIDRRIKIRQNWESNGWKVEFPLENDESLTSERQQEICQSLLGFIPELYKLGFSHNNCMGFCVKAGKKQWVRAMLAFPDEFEKWKTREKDFQNRTGKNNTILRKQFDQGKPTYRSEPYSLEQLEKDFHPKWQATPVLEAAMQDAFDKLDETRPCVFCEAM